MVMRLWRLLPPVESRLRAAGYDLTSFDWRHEAEVEPEASGPLVAAAGGAAAKSCGDVAEHILGCEIYWSRHGGDGNTPRGDDATRTRERCEGPAGAGVGEGLGGVSVGGGACVRDTAAGAAAGQACSTPAPPPPPPEGASFVGLMGEDDSGTWIESQNVAGLEILVKDDLRIWPDQLWVNDRGFDRAGNFVYGNQRSVPYKMRRVAAPGPLAWTLGEQYRTKETYAEKMSAIGVVPGQRFGPPARRPSAGARAGADG